MEKLIGMSNFVLEQRENKGIDSIKRFWNCEEYAKLLKTPLTLGILLPCDLEGNVLEKPTPTDFDNYHEEYGNILDAEGTKEYEEALEQYQQALDRVLFEGFHIEKHENNSFSIICENNILNVMWNFSDERGWFPARGIKTIEDLVPYNLTIRKNE